MIKRERRLTKGLAALLCLAANGGCGRREIAPGPPQVEVESQAMGRIRQVLARLPVALAKNHKTLVVPDGTVTGFGAGEGYPQIWLRDSAWLMPAAAAHYDADTLTSWLDLHLSVAEKNGRLRDWVAVASPETFREWAPRVKALGPLVVDTNTNESDQEPSAALAYCRVVEALGRDARVSGPKHQARVTRLITAMDALLRDRTDPKSGLVWSGLTADWGDVSPMYPDQRAIYLDARTPRTLSLYSNVMAKAALDCLADLAEPKGMRERLAARATKLLDQTRATFWMKDRGYFRLRRTLDPVPAAFGADENERFALGGNALAARFGVADDAQAASIFETAERLRLANGFSTISTTLIPPYAAGVFPHPAMREPFQYQNGGQWDWFGAALVEAEFERGHSEQARAHLDQIATRVLKAGEGIHEWYTQDGAPRGSASYAAGAASLHDAIFRGLLGISRSAEGYRVVIRSAETTSLFEAPQRAAQGRLAVSQKVDPAGIEVRVDSTLPVREVCTLVPAGRQPNDRAVPETAFPQSVRRVGKDILMCADVAAGSRPVRVRFALTPGVGSADRRP
jgi:hypothetical protein